MKQICINIDETKLDKLIDIEKLVDVLESHIYEAIDYHWWYDELTYEEAVDQQNTDLERLAAAKTVEFATNVYKETK